jgi:hypothetical protein
LRKQTKNNLQGKKKKKKFEIILTADCKISLFDTDTFLYSDVVLQIHYKRPFRMCSVWNRKCYTGCHTKNDIFLALSSHLNAYTCTLPPPPPPRTNISRGLSSELIKMDAVQRLFNYTDTKALASFPLKYAIGGYLRHSWDFSANSPSSAVFSGSCEPCVQVQTIFFGHIPDSVAMSKYNTILRPVRKISIQKKFYFRPSS